MTIKCAEIFSFFNCNIKELKIPIDPSLLDESLIEDPILVAVQKYIRHPGIRKIEEIIKNNDFFYFHHKDCDKMIKVFKIRL